MTSPPPFHVVVAGGGVAALEGALALRDIAHDAVALTIVAPGDCFNFRPLAVATSFAAGHVGRLSLGAFARDVDARLVEAALRAVDPAEREIELDKGERLSYDALLVATGARPEVQMPGALTWFDETDPDALGGLLRDVEDGYSHRVVFVVPPGSGWPLPLYELALMTARQVRGVGVDDAEIILVTPEAAPLSIFGPRASAAVASELEDAGVTLRTGAWAETHPDRRGTLVLRPGGEQLSADRVVTLPRLVGRRIEGLPANRNGFLPVDPHARVLGVERVWAAGDGTAFPVKQGGVAAQQADAAAQDIAAAAGLDIEPQPLDPVLRGTLLTGDKPWHLRWAAGEGDGLADRRPLWWPPTKVAGRHLSPYLAAHAEAPAGLSVAVPLSAGDDATFAESDVVPFPGAPPTARA